MKTNLKGLFLVSLFVCLAYADDENATTQGYRTELLPKGRLFRSSVADPREIRMSLAFEGNSRLVASVGNYFSIVGIESDDPDTWKYHVGIEGAGYFGLRQAESRFPLETTDGLIGVYLDAQKNKLQFQLKYTHVSAHLSDGSTETAVPYSREFIRARVGFLIDSYSHVYLGGHYVVNSVQPTDPYGLQVGGSVFFPWNVAKFSPYLAADLKWEAESEHTPSFALQLGIAINNPPEAYRSFRFFYAYFTGDDPRGQFADRQLSSHSFGIEMQI